MRKNMKKLTVATVIGAMTVTALAPVSAQAKDKTLTVAIWDNGQKAGLQEIMDEFTKETGIKTELQVVEWSSYWTLLEAGASRVKYMLRLAILLTHILVDLWFLVLSPLLSVVTDGTLGTLGAMAVAVDMATDIN